MNPTLRSYFNSPTAGYVAIAIAVIGALLAALSQIQPIMPPKDQAILGAVISFLGAVKAWLSNTPWSTVPPFPPAPAPVPPAPGSPSSAGSH